MRAIVTTAHSLGLRVAAHAHGARGIEAAARAGVDSIEHGTFADAAAIQAMRRSGTAMVPTLMAFTGVREGLAANRYTPTVAAKAREALAHLGEAARAARAAGVPVVFGTDAGVYRAWPQCRASSPSSSNMAGMSPAEAIASATTGAARLLGMENEIGRIAPGYSADLIAVDGRSARRCPRARTCRLRHGPRPDAESSAMSEARLQDRDRQQGAASGSQRDPRGAAASRPTMLDIFVVRDFLDRADCARS